MSLREKGKEAKRERIHSAARRLFATRGFHATTVAQIAKAARVATGTVFLYAPDKGALLAQVFCRDVALVQEQALAELDPELPFPEQLLAVFSAFYAYYDKDHALSRVFLKELLFSSTRAPEVGEATRTFLGAIAALAAAAQRRGELKAAANPLRIASIVFAGYWVCLVAWLGGAHASKETALGELAAALELVMDGIATRPAGPAPPPRAELRSGT
jgi:AcrR family transcriptional regulator